MPAGTGVAICVRTSRWKLTTGLGSYGSRCGVWHESQSWPFVTMNAFRWTEPAGPLVLVGPVVASTLSSWKRAWVSNVES